MRMSCYYCLKNNQQRNIYFALIKFALIKRYHLLMCNKVLLLFGKLLQRNLRINCHVNGTTFQSGLRFQTCLSSVRISCKRALNKYTWVPCHYQIQPVLDPRSYYMDPGPQPSAPGPYVLLAIITFLENTCMLLVLLASANVVALK